MREKNTKGYIFKTEQVLEKPVTEIFPFFSEAENLEKLTPSWLKFKINSPCPIQMKKGTIIDYQLKLFGIPIRWRSEIKVWDPPLRFIDVQLRGPYTLWNHEHRFEEQDGVTKMIDTVHYNFRGSFLKPLINHYFVGPNIRKIFDFRQSRIADIFKK